MMNMEYQYFSLNIEDLVVYYAVYALIYPFFQYAVCTFLGPKFLIIDMSSYHLNLTFLMVWLKF